MKNKTQWLPFEVNWKNPVLNIIKIMTTRPKLNLQVGDIIKPYSWKDKPYRSKWDKWGVELKIIKKFKTFMLFDGGDLFITVIGDYNTENAWDMSLTKYAKDEGFIDEEGYPDVNRLCEWFLTHHRIKDGENKTFNSYRFKLIT